LKQISLIENDIILARWLTGSVKTVY